MKKRSRSLLLGGLVVVVVLGGSVALSASETPLSDRIAASGYDTADLDEPECAVNAYNGFKECDESDVNLGHIGVKSYKYRAWPDRGCVYTFRRTGLGVFGLGSWEASIDWDPNFIGTDGYPINSAGFKDYFNEPTEAVHLKIKAPTPEELWRFTQQHLKEPDEKCMPKRKE